MAGRGLTGMAWTQQPIVSINAGLRGVNAGERRRRSEFPCDENDAWQRKSLHRRQKMKSPTFSFQCRLFSHYAPQTRTTVERNELLENESNVLWIEYWMDGWDVHKHAQVVLINPKIWITVVVTLRTILNSHPHAPYEAKLVWHH